MSNEKVVKGTMVLKRKYLEEFITIMNANEYAVNVIPVNDVYVEVNVIEGSFFKE